jgi:predicted nucleotidyltransferase
MHTPKTPEELIKSNLLVKHFAGSIAYGTNLPSSDTDYRGIFCAEPINLLTPFFNVKECTDTSEEDTSLWELSHFMKLCLDCNPNVVETLWVDDQHIVHRTAAYDKLREHRSDFLSKKIAFTTSGYALAQLKRIKGHNKWISNPQPIEAPTQSQFVSLVYNMTEAKVLPRDFNFHQLGKTHFLVAYGNDMYGMYPHDDTIRRSAYNADGTLASVANEEVSFEIETEVNKLFSKKIVTSRRIPSFIIKYNKDEYKLAKEKHKQYWDWRINRNEARGELEEKYGYDTKHAMHLVRLLRMGEEALTTGQLNVFREDAAELLDIRNGSLTYDEVVSYAEEKDNHIRNVLYKQSDVLQHKPDMVKVANILIDVQQTAWDELNVET